jgi:predicted metal-binding membrane protein
MSDNDAVKMSLGIGGESMLADRIRRMSAPHWLALYGLVLVSWLVLAVMAVPPDLRNMARVFGADFWDAFCTTTPDAAGFARLWVMWGLMSGAMMAPTALPALATYDDLSQSTHTDLPALMGGYLAVWLLFSGFAAALQMGLFQLGLVSSFGDSRSSVLSGGLLVLAGAYQFSALKEACLSKCRMPLTFFMQHWDEGAFRNGLRLGMTCLGCCWALMLLGFVGGVMSLGFMGLATLVMTFEKLRAGAWVTRPLGLVLIGAGLSVALW